VIYYPCSGELMKKMRGFAMSIAAAAALSCTGCFVFTILGAIIDSTSTGYGPDTASVLFDNWTNQTLTCSVNGHCVGCVRAFGQLAVRVNAGACSLEATSDGRSWGPVSVDLPKNGTYTWMIY
jgi:hypothetical protein